MRTRTVLTVCLALLFSLGTVALYATGAQQKSTAEEGFYTFTHTYATWDLADGRIPIEDQPKNEYFQYVGKRVGAVPLTISWEWEGGQGYLQGLRLLLASGDIPDSIYPWDMSLTEELIREGIAIPLDDLLQRYGPHIKATFSEREWDLVRAHAPNGKIYYVPDANSVAYLYTGRIRKDWLDRVHLAVPQTRDELLNVYRAFKRLDANGNGDPNDEIPVSGRQYMRWLDDLYMMHGVAMFEGYPQWRWDDKRGRFISDQVSDAMRESVAFLNTLWKEDLIDREFMLNSGRDWIGKINDNRVGHHYHIIALTEKFCGFTEKHPEAEWVYLPLPKVPGIPQQKYLQFKMGPPVFMITTAAKKPEKIVQWYDWGRTEEAALYHNLGIPGKDWTREGGKIKILREGVKPHDYAWVHEVVPYAKEAVLMSPFGEMKVKMIDAALKGGMVSGPENLGMPNTIYEGYGDFIPEEAKLYREWTAKFITGEYPMSRWDEYVKKWYESGGEVVTQRATAWYKKMYGK